MESAELTPFHSSSAAMAEAALPISTRRPATADGATGAAAGTPGEGHLGAGGGGDDVPLLDAGGLASGNRWPRQETLALLKIRSDMDAAFRDASLKAPLWDEVSRKLGELGYKRSSKKCKEKFENVHKYYRRTKGGRAGRQDGRSYRFFDQLEALHGIATMPSPPEPIPLAGPPPSQAQVSAPTPLTAAAAPPPSGLSGPELSFSTNTSSSSSDYDSEHEGTMTGRRKRKRRMMEFFEGMMRQVMERQESMHQRFLDALEKREQDRMIREEAWRRQEMLRTARERELAAQDHAAAASRDAAILSFLQRVTGQTVRLQTPPPPLPPPATPQSKVIDQKQQQQQSQPQSQNEIQITPPPPMQRHPPAASCNELMVGERSSEPHDPMSSRWPKSEVHALIQSRSRLDSRYHETSPKGPLWEEISAGMQRLGYNRSAKRCKEKWENINKYYKKVKESNKKRPDDAKTCPYFHQLDALYRNKHTNGGGGGGGGGGNISALDKAHLNLSTDPDPRPISTRAPSENQGEMEKNSNNGGNGENAQGDNSGMIMKKPEDIVKELTGQSNNDYGEHDSNNMDEYDEDDEEDDDEDGNGQYRIQFQKQNVGDNGDSGTAPNNDGGKASGSFMAMVR